MVTIEEIEEIGAKLQLTLDNPKSVRQQLQQINLVQQKLRLFKQELRKDLAELKPQDAQRLANGLITAGMTFLPRSVTKWGRLARVGTNEVIRYKNNKDREPYLEIQELIDEMLQEASRLKIEAQEYLLNSKNNKNEE